ncbi:MAG: hypothetical protein KC476_02090 [Cyanobacteria bacterium HKST-UBA06]|nr:hypothetical protein [Cyanobacteria bacterium HKST-UBA05]MCA9806720.1 hypothetical protein [Cyanobacteria bacterium HKST-UBA06]MCA9840510.1 hypothetical protein [Cyanobacteria bacterium HKST-UBA03]
MMLKQLLAATCGLAITVSMANGVLAAPDRGPELDPNFKGVINVDVIESDNMTYIDRIRKELLDKPAPQVGQSRAAIEAMYGAPLYNMAPGKDYMVYSNEYDITDGKVFRRNLSHKNLRLYEVSFNNQGAPSAPGDKATDVKLRVVPRLGDHKNLIDKLLGQPVASRDMNDEGQHGVYSIPRERFVFYNDVISNPYEAINLYFNAEGFVVGQEFLPPNHGSYVLSSTGRYVPFSTKAQPDRKIGF